MTDTPAHALRGLLEWIEANVPGERAAKPDFPSLYLCRQALALLEATTNTQADLTQRARALLIKIDRCERFPAHSGGPIVRQFYIRDDEFETLQSLMRSQSEREVAAAEARRAGLETALQFTMFHAETGIKPDGRHTAECIATDIRRALASPAPQEERR